MTVLLVALPAALASLWVLRLAEVGSRILIIQAAAMAAAALVALMLPAVGRWARGRRLYPFVEIVAQAVLFAPILVSTSSPERWLPIGSLNLYAAPVVLPVLFAAAAIRLNTQPRSALEMILPVTLPAAVLAMQPDASQALAYAAGLTVLLTRGRQARWEAGAVVVILAGVVLYAFSRPDPLQPVPHVEGVFALAFSRSVLLGVVILAAAVAFVSGLLVASQSRPWLAAAAAYYAVLFACSVAGLTPAPVIGYGAGPILGVGVLAAAVRRVE